jgi:hypothetical protein
LVPIEALPSHQVGFLNGIACPGSVQQEPDGSSKEIIQMWYRLRFELRKDLPELFMRPCHSRALTEISGKGFKGLN